MKKKKQNDCLALKDNIQKILYEKYKTLTDEERQATIDRKLEYSDSPIATFWRQNALRVADDEGRYKKAANETKSRQ